MLKKTVSLPFTPEELLVLQRSLTLKEKAQAMRLAIDKMEGALQGAESLTGLPELWGEPRHRPELTVRPEMTAGEVYRICDALADLTLIINSAEFNL